MNRQGIDLLKYHVNMLIRAAIREGLVTESEIETVLCETLVELDPAVETKRSLVDLMIETLKEIERKERIQPLTTRAAVQLLVRKGYTPAAIEIFLDHCEK